MKAYMLTISGVCRRPIPARSIVMVGIGRRQYPQDSNGAVPKSPLRKCPPLWVRKSPKMLRTLPQPPSKQRNVVFGTALTTPVEPLVTRLSYKGSFEAERGNLIAATDTSAGFSTISATASHEK